MNGWSDACLERFEEARIESSLSTLAVRIVADSPEEGAIYDGSTF
jgi:hypothetical protein